MKKEKVPELRFPGFSGKWEERKLGELGEFIKNYSYSRNDEGVGQYFHIHYGDIHSEYSGYINRFTNIPTISNSESHIELKVRDIVMADASEDYEDLGKAVVIMDNLDKELIAGLHTFAFRPKDTLDSLYFLNYTKSNSYKRYMYRVGTGVSVYGINKTNMSTLPVHVPSKVEQEKIGDFFYKIDKKIELQEKRIENLEEYKKAMMQRIFSQEIRFKDRDGEDYPDWEERIFKNLLDCIIDNRGKTPPIKNKGIPLLEVSALGDIYPNYKNVVKWVSEETYENWFRKHIQKNDLLFVTVGKTGLCSLCDGRRATIAQNVVGFRFLKENPMFMYYLLSYFENWKKIKRIEMGAVQPSVKVTQLITLKFDVPSLPEQNKIANFLSSLDKKIELEKEKLEKQREFKKGLMQRMFI